MAQTVRFRFAAPCPVAENLERFHSEVIGEKHISAVTPMDDASCETCAEEMLVQNHGRTLRAEAF